jgi:hypothetical protein
MVSRTRRESRPVDPRFLQECFLCGGSFQFAKNVYDGAWIDSYQIYLCKPCFESNHDGFVGEESIKIKQHMRDKGIPIPANNEKGWLPRGKW